jgi:copper chaperone CopZ
VTQAIESVEGVQRAEVDFASGTARVQASDCRQPKLEAITQAVAAVGFGATVTEATPRAAAGPEGRSGTSPAAAVGL